MKAIVYTQYGPPDVLQLREVERPSPAANEVLIRIKATTVTAEDPRQRSFSFPPMLRLPAGLVMGLRTPKRPILGFELAGSVTAVGAQVTRFRPGDPIYGYTGLKFGAYAEYICLAEDGVIAHKPANMTFAEAAAVPNGALTALVFLKKKGQIRPGEKVLIYGASGSVGTAAVQLAKYFGAHVTGVCSTRNLALVESLGADAVIDYTQENYADEDKRYDIIFDTVGKSEIVHNLHLLKPGGRVLLTDFELPEMVAMGKALLTRQRRIIGAASNFSWHWEDLDFLRHVIESGCYRSIIDRHYPLAEAAEAHRYVEQGRKRGNVVLDVDDVTLAES